MRPVHSFGVCTPRCCAAAVDRDAHVLTAPLGPFVVRWDLRSLERVAKFDVHEDVIVSLIRVRLSCWPAEAYLTCSFGGHLRLWNDSFEPLSTLLDIDRQSSYVSCYGDRIVITNEDDMKATGVTLVHVRARADPDGPPLELVVDEHVRRPVAFASFAGSAATAPPLLMEQVERRVLISWHGDDERAPTVLDGVLDAIAVDRAQGLLALAMQGRRVYLIDTNTLEILCSFKARGSGAFKTIALTNGSVACPTDGGAIHVYDVATLVALGPSEMWSDAHGLQPSWSMRVSTGVIHLFAWLDDAQTSACIVNDYELSVVQRAGGAAPRTVSFHAITCCGVDVVHRGGGACIAAGDFSGQLFCWRVPGPTPHARARVDGCVRSVAFAPDARTVVVGDTEGVLYAWDLDDSGPSAAAAFAQVDATVTSIAWLHGGAMLAVGTTSGHVTLFGRGGAGAPLERRCAVLAHEPADPSSEQDLRFGSLRHYAEVWSLCFAPEALGAPLLLTGSEDQSARIFRVTDDGDGATDVVHERTLTGHEAAVTCVQWKATDAHGVVLLTASDDRTIRVYDGVTFERRAVLSTADSRTGWHTITYCVLATHAAGTPFVMCGTSNGHVASWAQPTRDADGQLVFAPPVMRKLHTGSIEGLAWDADGGWLASCAADCTVLLFATQQRKLAGLL